MGCSVLEKPDEPIDRAWHTHLWPGSTCVGNIGRWWRAAFPDSDAFRQEQPAHIDEEKVGRLMPSCEEGTWWTDPIRWSEPEASAAQRRPTYSSGLPRRILTTLGRQLVIVQSTLMCLLLLPLLPSQFPSTNSCLVPFKILKLYKIFYHIESLNECMKY